MAEQLDFTQEANGCFRLAESETHADVKTILMGMGYGWLTLANHQKASSEAHREPIEEPTEEPADDFAAQRGYAYESRRQAGLDRMSRNQSG